MHLLIKDSKRAEKQLITDSMKREQISIIFNCNNNKGNHNSTVITYDVAAGALASAAATSRAI